MIRVLDDYELTVTGVMGSDLSVVNAARASFAKESSVLSERDIRLIHYLAKEGHESPFRHAVVRVSVRSTVRERLLMECSLGDNRNGFVFRPNLVHHLISGDTPIEASVEWRMTASLAGLVRLGGVEKLLAPYFPHSIEALTGYRLMDPPVEPILRPVQKVDVLDKGYVRLVDWLDGEDDGERVVSFEVKAPLMVRSQWFKYRVSSEHTPQQWIPVPWEELGAGNGDDGSDDPLYARNEASRRYVTMEPEFYVPDAWRSAPANKKQGSGAPVSGSVSDEATHVFRRVCEEAVLNYEQALAHTICAEQARLFLPAYALYTTWRWTASMSSVLHFLRQRLGDDAQWEINQYAKAVYELVESIFPDSLKSLGGKAP